MIKESIIDIAADMLENADFEAELASFKEKYPVLHSYLLNEQLSLLTEEEYQILWFDAMVLVRSFELADLIPTSITAIDLEDFESNNWSLFENSKPMGFRDKLNIFFEQTEQEDLLAFVEDSLADDEEMPISSAAKEIIFISLLSILDVLQ